MNIKRIVTTGAASALLLSNVAMPALAAPLANGSFETAAIDPGSYTTLNSGNTQINEWLVASGSIDYIGTYWTASEGTDSIDLNGNAKGSISQEFPTVVGATYNVTFDMSGNPDGGPTVKTVHVSATGGAETPFTFDTSGITKEAMGWTPEEYTFVATAASTTLTFASQDEGAYGAAIDNVVMTEEIPTTPTPTDTPTATPTPTVTPTPDPFAVPAECVKEGVAYGAPIVGTDGSNVINGTSGNDLIFALGGSDVVNGGNGQDCIVGGDGSDILHGNNEHDVVLGGDGSDSINGHNGNDILYGGAGSDAMDGGAGNDEVWGEAGSDALKGGNGADTIIGGTESDAANGNNGSDTCDAEAKISCEA